MKLAILIRGASASGKTTTAKALLKELPGYVFIHIDSHKHELTGDLSYREKDEIAHQKGLNELRRAIDENVSVIIDEVFRPEFYIPVTKMLEEAGYNILNVRIKINLELLHQRDKSREIQLGKDRLETLSERSGVIEGQLSEIKKGNDLIIDSSSTTLESGIKQILEKIDKFTD